MRDPHSNSPICVRTVTLMVILVTAGLLLLRQPGQQGQQGQQGGFRAGVQLYDANTPLVRFDEMPMPQRAIHQSRYPESAIAYPPNVRRVPRPQFKPGVVERSDAYGVGERNLEIAIENAIEKERDRVILAAAQMAVERNINPNGSIPESDVEMEEIFHAENLEFYLDDLDSVETSVRSKARQGRGLSTFHERDSELPSRKGRDSKRNSFNELKDDTNRGTEPFLPMRSEYMKGNLLDQAEDENWEVPPESESQSPTTFALEQTSLEQFLGQVTSLTITTAPVTLRWSLDDAINAALLYSLEIDELNIASLENFQDIGIQFGGFDTVSFFEQSFRDSNTPVGNNFEAQQGVGRIKGEEFNFKYGVRQKLLGGGEIELSKSFGTRDDNSGVLNPRDQANSQLALTVSKELLKGSGRSIGMNEVLIASQRALVEESNSVTTITELLGQVSNAYWQIFIARAKLIAAIENSNQANSVLNDLQARRNLDADPNLLEQARVSQLQQQAEADISYADLAKAQFELIRLVNAPELLANLQRIELIPTGITSDLIHPPDIISRQTTAIHNRAEVRAIVEEIKEAQLKYNFSVNELLPKLTFVAEAAFNGLSGERDFAASNRNLFDSNATYELGFNFEFPLQNREARFSKRKAELVLAKLSRRWSAAVESVKKDVLVAVQDLDTNSTLLERQRTIYQSSQERLAFLEQRRFNIPKEGTIPSLQLGQLLDVQAQLAKSKADFAEALANRQRSMFELNRATGILVQPGEACLTNPGSHSCVVVYRQYLESDRVYREHANQTADKISKIARREHSSWKNDCLNDCSASSAGFGYPQHEATIEISPGLDSLPWCPVGLEEAALPEEVVGEIIDHQPITSEISNYLTYSETPVFSSYLSKTGVIGNKDLSGMSGRTRNSRSVTSSRFRSRQRKQAIAGEIAANSSRRYPLAAVAESGNGQHQSPSGRPLMQLTTRSSSLPNVKETGRSPKPTSQVIQASYLQQLPQESRTIHRDRVPNK